MTKMRIPAAYVRSGDVLFAILGSDNADFPALKAQAAEALKVEPESVSAALPAEPFATMKVVDLSDAASGSPAPVPAREAKSESEHDATGVEKAQAGMPAFYAALGRNTPAKPKEKEVAPGLPSAFDYGAVIKGKRPNRS